MKKKQQQKTKTNKHRNKQLFHLIEIKDLQHQIISAFLYIFPIFLAFIYLSEPIFISFIDTDDLKSTLRLVTLASNYNKYSSIYPGPKFVWASGFVTSPDAMPTQLWQDLLHSVTVSIGK